MLGEHKISTTLFRIVSFLIFLLIFYILSRVIESQLFTSIFNATVAKLTLIVISKV